MYYSFDLRTTYTLYLYWINSHITIYVVIEQQQR